MREAEDSRIVVVPYDEGSANAIELALKCICKITPLRSLAEGPTENEHLAASKGSSDSVLHNRSSGRRNLARATIAVALNLVMEWRDPPIKRSRRKLARACPMFYAAMASQLVACVGMEDGLAWRERAVGVLDGISGLMCRAASTRADGQLRLLPVVA